MSAWIAEQPPRWRSEGKLKFEVLAGVHRGVILTLDDAAEYRIGCSPQADIVLSDSGVAPDHAVLRVQGATVWIDAVGGEAAVARERIPAGHGCRVRLPVDVTLGGARMHLSNPLEEGWRGTAGWIIRRPITALGGLACCGFVVAAVAGELPQIVQAVGAKSDPPVRAEGATVASEPRAGLPSLVASQAALEARLQAAHIETLQVTAVDGRLAVAGKLTKQEAIDWAAIQRWFDQTYRGRVVLTANISAENRAGPSLQLQAVWYGDRPYVITAEGERYYQGAVLDSGWVIREIGEDRLLLVKNGETATLTYK